MLAHSRGQQRGPQKSFFQLHRLQRGRPADHRQGRAQRLENCI